ncbi:MAG: ComEC/Rec2 family competence protein [candidate division WOR-3 bacterium]|nr:ComEC/Rec2 family competence protein [candidate division WOR-3 bacterium]MDW8114141.1 ComEC/Rec2 family competence protein [candidate division WOR-3 bacterium]
MFAFYFHPILFLLLIPFIYLTFREKRYFYYLFFFISFSFYAYISKTKEIFEERNFLFHQKVINYIENIFDDYLEKENKGLVYGLFFGDKSKLSYELKEIFKKTGLYHILAVSGLHITIFAFVILTIFNIFQIPFSLKYFLLIFFILLYACLCSFRPSILRAGIMFLFLSFSYFLNRKTLPIVNLFSSGILILLFSPLSLFNISFQLSFLATFGILYFYPYFNNLKINNSIIKNLLIKPFFISLSCYFATLPILISNFGTIPTASIFANLIVAPLIGFIIPLILIVLFFSLFSSFLTLIFSQSLNLLLKLLIILTKFFSQIFPLIKIEKEYGIIFLLTFLLITFLINSFYQNN